MWRLLLAIVLLTAPGCAGDDAVEGPNVVVVVLDTVRADHLSGYGYERKTSPNLDAFAASATLYQRAQASAPWTLPSHASMFTGKDPFQHGAHTLEGRSDHGYANVNPLPLSQVTLAEALTEIGYETAAIAANTYYLDTRWQLDQGFATYHVEGAHAPVINQRVAEWLDDNGSSQFFLFINYMDAHRPYNCVGRPPFLDRAPEQDGGALAKMLEARMLNPRGRYPENLEQRVIDQYDTAIYNLDAEVGRLLEELRRRGLYDDALLIVTSDHGEAFGEHGLVEHGRDVYQPELWIPFIVKLPGQTVGSVVDEPVSLSNVPRMVFAQLPALVEQRYAKTFPNVAGAHPTVSENYYLRGPIVESPVFAEKAKHVRTALLDWPYKYIESTDGTRELYDLSTDPQELTSLERVGESQRLARALSDYMSSRPRSSEVVEQSPMTEEELKRMRAIGYVK